MGLQRNVGSYLDSFTTEGTEGHRVEPEVARVLEQPTGLRP